MGLMELLPIGDDGNIPMWCGDGNHDFEEIDTEEDAVTSYELRRGYIVYRVHDVEKRKCRNCSLILREKTNGQAFKIPAHECDGVEDGPENVNYPHTIWDVGEE